MDKVRVLLDEKDLPQYWYNLAADLPFPLEPPLNPATREPIGPEDLAPIFPRSLIEQEVSNERFLEIPGEIREVYRLWRPTPLCRAVRLEKHLQTPARIYYKDESVSPPGSHKPNTAVAQAYYNKREGVSRLVTETGAGQWGSALAFACNLFDLHCRVFMVKISYEQKPFRKSLMNLWGAEIFPSPSSVTKTGRGILEKDPDCHGSLGIAISEAIEEAVNDGNTKYSLGSVLNHVLLHQTVIGQEAKIQMEMAGDYPDVLIGCVGGGSNFAGIAFPFVKDRMEGKEIRFLAVEPTACPTLTTGKYEYDFGDTAEMTPLIKMYTLGHTFIPEPIHAGGLRYHGMAPLVSALHANGIVEAVSYRQKEVFEAAVTFARTEGKSPAPETAHAIRAAIDEALRARESGEEKAILFNYSGHGHFDLSAFDLYFSGGMTDHVHGG